MNPCFDPAWLRNVALNVALFIVLTPTMLLIGKLFYAVSFTRKRLIISTLILMVGCAVQMTLFLPGQLIAYLIPVIAGMLICWWQFELRRWSFVTCSLACLGANVFIDLLTAMIATSFHSRTEMLLPYRGMDHLLLLPQYELLLMLSTTAAALAVAIGTIVARIIYDWARNRRWPTGLRLLRPILLGCVTVLLGLKFMADMEAVSSTGVELMNNVTMLIFPAAMLITVLYLTLDIRTLMLSHKYENLVKQQQIYDALLIELRQFRHNIGNMLYGMEGKILSGDMDEVQTYYEQMAERCTRINNENILALERMPSTAVAALILNKIQTAQDKEIPFYLDVEDGLHWRGMRDSQMCEVTGALIDNAIEAAVSSAAPQVAVEFGMVDGAMEMIVRNTFAKDADLQFLFTDAPSSKPGHDGLGLVSVRKIVRADGRVMMNQIQHGRYIETILVFEK